MKTHNIILAMLLFNIGCLLAQEQEPLMNITPSVDNSKYRTAVGLRAGIPSGLTVKTFVSRRGAIEGILGVTPESFSTTLLYEHYTPISNVSGLYLYYGGGAHVTVSGDQFYNYYRYERYPYAYRSRGIYTGIDGIIGSEYKIPQIPFAISLDLKPTLEFSNYGHAYLWLDPGLGIKFTF